MDELYTRISKSTKHVLYQYMKDHDISLLNYNFNYFFQYCIQKYQIQVISHHFSNHKIEGLTVIDELGISFSYDKKEMYEIDLKTTSAKHQLASLFDGKPPFDYPKNVGLLKLLLSLNTRHDITILDFFDGSGTTGHAVAQLNKEDSGKRKYILCTNNENNICEEVTYKRLLNIQKDLPHNLKYFKTKFINKDDEELEYVLLNNVKTLIELEHSIDLEESDKAVAFTLSEIRELDLSGIKTVYVRQHSHALMNKEDKLRYKNIELIDVPEYYFASEMREAGL